MKKHTPLHKIPIANLPTPLHRLERLSSRWGGDLWIKRDDLTESALSGNKVRKLEYLISDAIRREADTIITCGGIQSNHCRATALAAARFGLNTHLVLRGEAPHESDGNVLLDRLAGATIHFIPSERYYTDLDNELAAIASDIVTNGGKPYITTEGGSDPVGTLGYVDAVLEMMEQCRRLKIEPRRIIVANGSGGTHAGLFVGTKLYGWGIEVVSMAVCYNHTETVNRIASIINAMIDRYSYPIRFTPQEIRVVEMIGGGYAVADTPEFELIREVARTEGIILDPVYTGKAMLGLKRGLEKGDYHDGATIFLHTGGIFGLFPFKDGL